MVLATDPKPDPKPDPNARSQLLTPVGLASETQASPPIEDAIGRAGSVADPSAIAGVQRIITG